MPSTNASRLLCRAGLAEDQGGGARHQGARRRPWHHRAPHHGDPVSGPLAACAQRRHECSQPGRGSKRAI